GQVRGDEGHEEQQVLRPLVDAEGSGPSEPPGRANRSHHGHREPGLGTEPACSCAGLDEEDLADAVGEAIHLRMAGEDAVRWKRAQLTLPVASGKDPIEPAEM